MIRFVVCLLSCLVAAQTGFGAVVINLTQSGMGVEVSVSGSGNVTAGGDNPGSVLNFDNFSGTPWNSSVDGDFSLAPANAIDFGPSLPSFATIRLDFVGSGTSDLDFRDPSAGSVSNGDAFSASGTATVQGLLFSNLNVGTYTSTGTDSDNFGGVTLNIAASTSTVPEPGYYLVLGGVLLGLVLRRQRSRRSA